jgi:hypothetical protein
MSAKKEKIKLPDFVKKQTEIINSLQKRVNQLNKDFEIEKKLQKSSLLFHIRKRVF